MGEHAEDDCVFVVEIVKMRHDAPQGSRYPCPPLVRVDVIPDKRAAATKDRLWDAVKMAVDIMNGLPGNLCTSCNEQRLAWAGTTTCPVCSLGLLGLHDTTAQTTWADRVLPTQRFA